MNLKSGKIIARVEMIDQISVRHLILLFTLGVGCGDKMNKGIKGSRGSK